MTSLLSENHIIAFKAVAEGTSLAQTGKLIGKSSTTVNQYLAQVCRAIQIPFDLSEIRKNKSSHLEKINHVRTQPVLDLNHKVANNLQSALKIASPQDLTPKYASNVAASQLLTAKLTLIAVADTQIWLSKSGLSLKKKPPQTHIELNAAKRAIALLDAFHFDTKLLQQQLAHLETTHE